jgi:non-specific serine/threonine protein kinase
LNSNTLNVAVSHPQNLPLIPENFPKLSYFRYTYLHILVLDRTSGKYKMGSATITPNQFVTFGELLKYLRRREGLTQRELSIAVQYSDTQINRLEKNQRVPDATTLTALFLPALHIEDQPEWSTRFLALAAKARKESTQRRTIDTRSLATPSHNLPFHLTSFIGRKADVTRIKQRLSQHRLVSLTGVGGIGKTRLAIHCSSTLLSKFRDGIWWVDLVPLTDEALLPQAIAQVLGVRESPTQSLIQSVESFLREKQLLLVLDNCEHLISACAQLAEALLTQCANLRILATSREALGITGEVVYQVPTLSLPASQPPKLIDSLMEYEGVYLFVERAEARSGFTLTEQNATAVLQICQQLDGIPLALELAAARTELLSAEEIAERLSDRFNLLRQGNRTVLPRHQTLRAAIDWSYDLLSHKELVLFRRLAVFEGGWTFQEVKAVCSGDDIGEDEILDLLGHLVDKSLVIMQVENGNARYRMLETIRQFAHEKFMNSIEAERVQKRHLEFFVHFAEEADPNLNGPEQVAWLDRLGTEHANFRAALGWALEHHELGSAARLGTGLSWFWVFRAHLREGWQWLEQIIELSRRLAQTEQMSPSAKALFAHVLNRASLLAYYRGRQTLAGSLGEEGLALSRKIKNKKLIIEALLPLGFVVQNQGDYERAGALLEEKLALSREVGEKWDVARALVLLGNVALNQKDYVSARIRYEEGLAISREIRHRLFIAIFSNNLGHVALNEGNYTAARELYTEAMLLAQEVGSDRYMMIHLVGWAGLARALGQLERATRLSGAVEALREYIGSRLEQEEQVEHERTISAARSGMDETMFDQLWREGQAMTLEQAVTYALEEA